MARTRVLERIRACVRAERLALTLHADDEMRKDELTVRDVMSALLHGRVILQQLDRERHQRKYVVEGPSDDGSSICVVCRFGPMDDLIVITVFRGSLGEG